MLRGTKINLYIRVMERLGISAQALLANTNIDSNSLRDPHYSVSQAMYHAVIFNMLKLSSNPGIAFLVGKEFNAGDLGFAGYAMLASSTLGQVITIRQRYNDAFFGTQIVIESARNEGQGYELTISSRSPTERLRRFEIEEYMASGIHFLPTLTGIEPVFHSVSFSYPKPDCSAEYDSLFKCPLIFDAPQTTLRIAYPNLDTPILSKNEELFEICTKHCQKIMNSSGVSSHLRDQLCNLFLSSPQHLPDLHEAGTKLGISTRRLRRMLQAEGTNYEALKAEFRLDLSRQLLTEARMTPKQVAFFLGYTTPSAFSRAFKAWTGQTVQTFMRS
jgi:AraC-like DNA-binding protein